MMEHHTTDFDAAPALRMHEALTPELLRHFYSEDQLPASNPLRTLWAALRQRFRAQFFMR